MYIVLNGEAVSVSAKTIGELKNIASTPFYNEKYIAVVNGFTADDDTKLNENDEIFIIPKDCLPDEKDIKKMIRARQTPHIFDKLENAYVGIAGLGGLGSNIAVALARSGVGHLILVDFDTVDISNLNRQHYRISDLGKPKTQAIKEQLSEINPYIEVITLNKFIDENNVCDIFQRCNIVCEAFDKPECKAQLVNTLLKKTDKYIVAASGMAGYGSSNEIVTKKAFSRLYVCGDGESEAKQFNGLMAPRVITCAGHQANMVIRLILNIKDV